MLWQREHGFVGVVHRGVGLVLVDDSRATIMVVVGNVLINTVDFGRLLGMAQDFAQRVMRRRQPGRQQRQKRCKQQSGQQDDQRRQR